MFALYILFENIFSVRVRPRVVFLLGLFGKARMNGILRRMFCHNMRSFIFVFFRRGQY
nr:hypothetical protein [Marseillevirus cajuinensis]